jgi:sterol 3beta-glucosyltransferase
VNIAIVALDTRGGVQPYVALGLGLHAAGHDVRMVVHGDAAPPITARGLGVVALPANAEQTVRASGASEMGLLEQRRFMQEHMRATIGPQTRIALDGCADADLVSGGVGGSPIGRAVAEKLRRPFVEAHLQPVGPPTGAFPGPLLPVPERLGPVARRLSHRVTALGVGLITGASSRLARRELGLPARPAPPETQLPTLYGYSPLVVPRPPEWGPHRHVTGYWTLRAGDWTPPPELTVFLDAGPPPVCIGFGSMVGRDPAALHALTVEAARRAGVRAVLLAGWGGLAATGETAGEDVLVLDQAPHDWLFPRCAAVVHHGGAGTTGAGLRAGVPAVVVPFGVDQPFWGSRVATLGVGPRPIPRRKLTAERLADALRASMFDRRMRERAHDLGVHIRAENGVGEAVARYTELAARLAVGCQKSSLGR